MGKSSLRQNIHGHASDLYDTDESENNAGINFLKFFNGILILTIIVLSGYLIVNQLFPKEVTVKGFSETGNISSDKVSGESLQLPKAKAFEIYQEKLSRRDVFMAPWEQERLTPEGNEAPNALDLSKPIHIVGIVLDGDPKVIVENLQTKETVFLL